jgi:hypothetical protein
LLAAASLLALVAVSPPLRGALAVLEPAVAPLLFLAAVLLAALRWAGRHRRVEVRLSRFLGAWGWALGLLAFLLPLLACWAQRPPSRIAAFSSLLGWIPWGDAHGHYEGGTRLLAEGSFGGFSERRPLTAAWLALRLGLTGNSLPAALIVQAIGVGLSAWLAARAVGRRFGLGPALATFALVLGLTRDYLPTAVTEPFGIALACLALVVLVSRGARRSYVAAALGVLLLGTALQARPGAQFMLPFVMAWVVAMHRRSWARAGVAVVLAALATLLHTRLLNGLYGAGEASATSYPALTLYGLAHHSNYDRAYRDLGPELERFGEKAGARYVYWRAASQIMREPGLFLSALRDNELEFVNKLFVNVTRAVSPRWLFAPLDSRIRPSGAEIAADRWQGGPPVVAAGAGLLVALWSRRRTSEAGFWLSALGGVAASAPFIFADAGFRGLAAGYPFLGAALGLGLVAGREGFAGSDAAERRDVRASVLAVLAVLGLTLVAPPMLHALAPRPHPRELQGLAAGEVAVIDLKAAARVLVTNRGETHPGVPTLRRPDFVRLLELAEFSDPADLQSRRLPFAVLSAFDHVAHRQRALIAPPRLLREPARFVRLQIQAAEGSQFFAEVVDFSPLPR